MDTKDPVTPEVFPFLQLTWNLAMVRLTHWSEGPVTRMVILKRAAIIGALYPNEKDLILSVTAHALHEFGYVPLGAFS